MLFIDEGQKVPLPKKYHTANNVCAIIYDQLTEILSSDYYAQMNSTTIDFSTLSESMLNDLDNNRVHALEILAQSNRNAEIEIVLSKHITMSILSDFCHFVYESLSCAQRGKMTVAYALLRKPFVDELLMLEQILIDKTKFVDLYYHVGDPKNYDPSSKKLDRSQIVSEAVKKTKNLINGYMHADIIYGLRYDKGNPSGINGISNQALHIVTNDSNYKTENQELNFVFNSDIDVNKFWNHYYYFVPLLLIYAARIIDGIVFEFLDYEAKGSYMAEKELKRLAAFSQTVEKKSKKAFKRIFKTLGFMLSLKCSKCGGVSNIDTEEAYVIFLYGDVFLCSHCAEILEVNDEYLSQLEKLIAMRI